MTEENAQHSGPAISVLMSVYNGGRYLADSIRSILDQSFGDFEFLIVDDASSDGSLEIIEEFACNDKRIVILRNECNLGLTRSLNLGLDRARGKYIARQDADDISLPKRLEKQWEFLEANHEIGVMGTAYYLINACGEIIGERSISRYFSPPPATAK